MLEPELFKVRIPPATEDWPILDLTPAGRGADLYPKLDYGKDGQAQA